jgi:transcriptional regulator with XRE-family HTH domain
MDWLPSGKTFLVCKAQISDLNLLYPLFLGHLKHCFMTFGERVALHRKQLKMSQHDLAGKVGTSAPIIGRYERDAIKPSIEMAKKIADALDVTVDYLIAGSANLVMDKKLMKRIEDIEALPAEEKDKVYYFIDMAITHNKAKRAFAK